MFENENEIFGRLDVGRINDKWRNVVWLGGRKEDGEKTKGRKWVVAEWC